MKPLDINRINIYAPYKVWMVDRFIRFETDYGIKQTVFDKIKEIADEKQLLMINEV